MLTVVRADGAPSPATSALRRQSDRAICGAPTVEAVVADRRAFRARGRLSSPWSRRLSYDESGSRPSTRRRPHRRSGGAHVRGCLAQPIVREFGDPEAGAFDALERTPVAVATMCEPDLEAVEASCQRARRGSSARTCSTNNNCRVVGQLAARAGAPSAPPERAAIEAAASIPAEPALRVNAAGRQRRESSSAHSGEAAEWATGRRRSLPSRADR
jgi:hypothetical protein